MKPLVDGGTDGGEIAPASIFIGGVRRLGGVTGRRSGTSARKAYHLLARC
jgi:hypothetical protein